MRCLIVCAMTIWFNVALPAADFDRSEFLPAPQILPSSMTNASTRPTPPRKADRIVVYSASWCPPCQRLKPVIATLKREGYRVEYRDVDRDANRLIYPYTAVPTIFFLRDDAVIKLETGFRSKEQITQTLVMETDRGDQTVRLHRAVRPFDQVPIHR